ncbi:MAG: hypothetical protein WC657_02245 [Candidatus Paceibacterota bacterium]
MITRITVLTAAFLLAGCAGPPQAPPSVWVREVEPPTIRYQIKYQNRGLQVDPDFAAIDRNGEYVVTPQM